jgi:hypothetical protein
MIIAERLGTRQLPLHQREFLGARPPISQAFMSGRGFSHAADSKEMRFAR